MEKKNRSIIRTGLTVIAVIFLLCSSLTWAQDNSQTKTEYGSTVTISGPFTVPPNQSYDIILNAVTDAPIYQWGFYEDSVLIAGSGFVFGQTLDKTYSFTKTVDGSHTYLLRFRGIAGAHGFPPYTEVSITVDIAPVDTTPPVITIINPCQCANYDWAQLVPVNYYATDPESGIKEVTSRIDTTIVQNNTSVQASSLSYGNHILIVRAVNNVGLEATAYVTFKVNLSSAGMASIIDSYVADGLINNKGIGQSLKAKLPSPSDNPNAATGKLNAFINYFINTQSSEKHIKSEIVPFLFQYAKSQLAQLSPPLADLPQTLPYISKLDSYAKITLPNSDQTIDISLRGSKYTMNFYTTSDPNIIGYNVVNYQVPLVQFQIDGHNVGYTAWQDPNNPSAGTINLAMCGLITEHISNLFTLTVDGQTYGPYPFVMDLVGVQRWPDIYTSDMSFYGHSVMSSDVPYLANAEVETSHGKKQNSILSSNLTATQTSDTTWALGGGFQLTPCAIKNGLAGPPDINYAQTGGPWSNEKIKIMEDPKGSGTYKASGTIILGGGWNQPASFTISITITPLVCNPETISVTVTYTPPQ